MKAGKKKPLLVVDSVERSDDYKDALLVSIFGAFEAVYVVNFFILLSNYMYTS